MSDEEEDSNKEDGFPEDCNVWIKVIKSVAACRSIKIYEHMTICMLTSIGYYILIVFKCSKHPKICIGNTKINRPIGYYYFKYPKNRLNKYWSPFLFCISIYLLQMLYIVVSLAMQDLVFVSGCIFNWQDERFENFLDNTCYIMTRRFVEVFHSYLIN